jgi:hypothetical protein
VPNTVIRRELQVPTVKEEDALKYHGKYAKSHRDCFRYSEVTGGWDSQTQSGDRRSLL